MSNKQPSPMALEQEIEETRERLATTIDQLLHRSHPKTIVSREVEQVKGFFVDSATGEPRTENILKVAGGILGAVVANLMFELPAIEWSTHTRSSGGLWLGELVATFGLLTVILGVVRSGRTAAVPFAVGAYIGAAYWFTSSTSFANPAVTAARTLTDTFAGINPSSVPLFVVAQCAGAGAAVALARFLHPALPDQAEQIVVPRDEP